MPLSYIVIFIISCFVLALAAKRTIDSLDRIAKYLGWKEFVVAFFTVSVGAVAPEFFIGLSSAFHKIPELSLGSIIGQNLFLFSFTVGLCAIILKNGIEVESRTVRAGSVFAVAATFLPLILMLDGTLSRTDGIVLLLFFVFFVFWLFSKKERFVKEYDHEENKIKNNFLVFIKEIGILFIGLFFIILSAEGIIRSSLVFSQSVAVSLPIIGLFVVALGVGLPETYFALMLAKKGQSWMILGGLMGAVAISCTLVLGTVSLISPISIEIEQDPSLLVAGIFLILCSLFYLFFAKSRSRLSTKEGIFLLLLYLFFLIVFFTVEILIK